MAVALSRGILREVANGSMDAITFRKPISAIALSALILTEEVIKKKNY